MSDWFDFIAKAESADPTVRGPRVLHGDPTSVAATAPALPVSISGRNVGLREEGVAPYNYAEDTSGEGLFERLS